MFMEEIEIILCITDYSAHCILEEVFRLNLFQKQTKEFLELLKWLLTLYCWFKIFLMFTLFNNLSEYKNIN